MKYIITFYYYFLGRAPILFGVRAGYLTALSLESLIEVASCSSEYVGLEDDSSSSVMILGMKQKL